jgi:hypothetical protein
MLGLVTEQRFCVEATLLASEASHALVAADANVQLVVTYVHTVGMVAADAHTLRVGDSSDTVNVLELPSSIPVLGQEHTVGPLTEGVALTKGEALGIYVSGAGPSVHCVVEGYKLRV